MVLGLGLTLLVTGCAHYPVNAKLEGKPSQTQGYRFDNLETTDDNGNEIFICLAFSGGGMRASALSYGVLEALRDTRITWNGRTKRLLDEVDCISSVSGGSFTAAYYGLFHDRIFTDFHQKYLYADVQGSLGLKAANPGNWFRLASPYYDRIDLAAEYYNDEIFEGKTFGDLRRSKRPYIMLNATNMATGELFSFTQDEFDFLGSNLDSYPVARGVAASSAFPFLLSPITVANHPHTVGGLDEGIVNSSGYDPDDPTAYDNQQPPGGDYADDRVRYRSARSRMNYLDARSRPWLHLMDGGLADNIGVQNIGTAYRYGFLQRILNRSGDQCKQPGGCIKHFVLVAVNAYTEDNDDISRQESGPGLGEVFYKTATIAMDTHSFASILSLQGDQARRMQDQSMLVESCKRERTAECAKQTEPCDAAKLAKDCDEFARSQLPGANVRHYFINVDLEGLDRTRRERFQKLPTALTLPPKDVKDLVAVSRELLTRDESFQQLLKDIGSAPATSAANPPPK
jgi:NTE family protein